MPVSRPTPANDVRVLIVDDHVRQRALLSTVVSELGWTAAAACDGASGFEACLNGGPFDLIVMDYRMPAMNGCDATRRIRALGGWAARVPIIGATADFSIAVHAECLHAGMTNCIPKPIQPLAFAELMRRFLIPQQRTLLRAAG